MTTARLDSPDRPLIFRFALPSGRSTEQRSVKFLLHRIGWRAVIVITTSSLGEEEVVLKDEEKRG